MHMHTNQQGNSHVTASLLLIAVVSTGALLLYPFVTSMVESQINQALTWITFRHIHWHLPNNTITVTIYNHGDISYSITSIGVREHHSHASYDINTKDLYVPSHQQMEIRWTGTTLHLHPEHKYTIRLTSSTGAAFEIERHLAS
jgi:hypothetical protein